MERRDDEGSGVDRLHAGGLRKYVGIWRRRAELGLRAEVGYVGNGMTTLDPGPESRGNLPKLFSKGPQP